MSVEIGPPRSTRAFATPARGFSYSKDRIWAEIPPPALSPHTLLLLLLSPECLTFPIRRDQARSNARDGKPDLVRELHTASAKRYLEVNVKRHVPTRGCRRPVLEEATWTQECVQCSMRARSAIEL